jgi:hypothetical protein
LRELPLFLQRHNYRLPANELRLLDTETLQVKPYSVEQRGEEELSLDGRTFHCRVFSITASKKESSYWIAEDELGAFLVKERGKDEGVAYEILLKTYNESK